MSRDKSGNWLKRHKILSGILAIIVIAVIASAAGGDSKQNSGSAAKPSGSTSSKPAQIAKIGQEADDGNFAFTVTSVQCGEPNVTDSSGYLTKTAQGQYCLLNLRVKNIGDKAQTLDSMSQYLYNSSNQKYSSDSEATIYENPANGTFLNSINPGNAVNGIVVFDVPKGVTPTVAELHDSSLSGGVKVNLQ